MIKDNKGSRPFFHPTFGSRPAQIVGRDGEIKDFLEGLRDPVGSHRRCTLFMLCQRMKAKAGCLIFANE